MCRPTDHDLHPRRSNGRDRLEIRAFYLRLAGSGSPPPELTLVYLPSIGGAALEVNGRKLPPASPASVPLRRAAAAAQPSPAIYVSADRVAACQGARFEAFTGCEKAAEGVFLRGGRGWRVECRRSPAATSQAAEVVVVAEGGVMMREKVRARRRGFACARLEEIPEEEMEMETDGCGWKWGGDGDEEWEMVESNGGEMEMGVGMETADWALDVGIWVVCLGVGLLVSRAAARRLARKRIFW